MKILQLGGEKYELLLSFKWKGKNPTVVKWLNDYTKIIRESYSPSAGPPRSFIFNNAVKRFNATVIADVEPSLGTVEIY